MSNISVTKTPKSFMDISRFYFKNYDLYPGIILDPKNPGSTRRRHRKPQNSWKLTDWVTRNTNLKRSSKLVSIQVASLYNSTLGYSYPDYETLMERTGLGYGSVARAIQDMKLSGEWLILSTSENIHSRHTNNRYYYLSPTENDSFPPSMYKKDAQIEFTNLQKEIPTSQSKIEKDKDDQDPIEKRKISKSYKQKLDFEDFQRIWIPEFNFSTLKEYNSFIKDRVYTREWYRIGH